MPNLDGTGPEGKGPLTGRRRGQCRDKKNEDKESIERKNFVFGRRRGERPRGGGGSGLGGGGRRRGRGFGRGFGSGQGYGRRVDHDLPENPEE